MVYLPTPSMVNLLSRYGSGGERIKCEREAKKQRTIFYVHERKKDKRDGWMTRGVRKRSGERTRKKEAVGGRGVERWLARMKEAEANEPSFTSVGR